VFYIIIIIYILIYDFIIMKKIKNKFIIWVILIITIILSFQFYSYYNLSNFDRKSYAVLVNWSWEINGQKLYENEKKVVNTWDRLKTIWKKSILVLEWWDWSITRLWWNTIIIVNENNISNDLTKINVSFNLLSWKTWSNVINFMWQDSYFREYFNDIEAWVRWTVFDVNLDNNYIYVSDHEVSLKVKNWKTYKIWQDKPFSIKSLNFVDLQIFMLNIRNKAWENLNNKFDINLINNLKNKLETSLKENNSIKLLSKLDIKSLSLKEKEKAYNNLLSQYQQYNFVTPTDEKLFKIKMEIKSSLITLANKENKNALLKTVIYDINNAISLKKDKLIENMLPIIKKYKNIIPDIDIERLKNINKQIKNFIWDSWNKISDKLKWFVEWAWEKIGGKINNLLDNLKK